LAARISSRMLIGCFSFVHGTKEQVQESIVP
jgi:hypothetical protein